MSNILFNVVNISISASFLIVAIMLLRIFFKSIPKFIFCILWGIVAIRLICPFSFESKFGVVPNVKVLNDFENIHVRRNGLVNNYIEDENYFNASQNHINSDFNAYKEATNNDIKTNFNTYQENSNNDTKTNFNTYQTPNNNVTQTNSNILPSVAINNDIQPNFNAYQETTNNDVQTNFNAYQEDNNTQSKSIPIEIFILTNIWLIGIVVVLIYSMFAYYKLRKKITPSILLKDNIFLCDNITEPFVLGFLRPKIYLPSNIDENNKKYILLHEQAHIMRKDYLWKPIGYLILAIHWFNPFVWIAYNLFCSDIEFATDEKVIKNFGMEDKKEYSRVLLSFSISKPKFITACPIAFGEIKVKERIKMILNYKKQATVVVVICVILCVLVAICFLANHKTEDTLIETYYNNNLSENIENLTLEDIINLQSEVSNGHYSWRMNAEDTAKQYLYENYDIKNTETLNTTYNSEKLEATVTLKSSDIDDNITYIIELMQNKKDGIWIIKNCSDNMKKIEIGLITNISDNADNTENKSNAKILDLNGNLKEVYITNDEYDYSLSNVIVYTSNNDNEITYHKIFGSSIQSGMEVEDLTLNSIKLRDQDEIKFKNSNQYVVICKENLKELMQDDISNSVKFYLGSLEDIDKEKDFVSIQKYDKYYILVYKSDRERIFKDVPEDAYIFNNFKVNMFLGSSGRYYKEVEDNANRKISDEEAINIAISNAKVTEYTSVEAKFLKRVSKLAGEDEEKERNVILVIFEDVPTKPQGPGKSILEAYEKDDKNEENWLTTEVVELDKDTGDIRMIMNCGKYKAINL